MKKEIKIPNLGDNISSAEIVKILVKVGDKIQKDQPILEIASDKANIEIPSDFEGIVDSILLKEGDLVSVDQLALTITTGEVEVVINPVIDSIKPEIEVKSEIILPTIKAEAVEKSLTLGLNIQVVPNLGDNVASSEVIKFLVKIGDKVEKEQPLLELGSDKANIEITSEFEGVVKKLFAKAGDLLIAGDKLLAIEGFITQDTSKPSNTEIKSDFKPEIKVNHISEKTILDTTSELRVKGAIVPAAPSIRRFAREIGIDINQVKGTGQNGRISIEDVKAFSKALNTQRATEPLVTSRPTNTYHEVLPDFCKWGEIKKEAMNNVRLKTAQHLTFAWNNIPHVTHFEKIDITEVEKWRKQYAKKTEVLGGKLTITAILAKVVALALKNFPRFNASIDVENKEIIYKNYYNIGIAVDTDRGLLVPVIKEANTKNILQLSADLAVIAEKAKSKKLALEDMQGATFTISNLGGIGGIGFTPVVNYPEVAILGISKSSYEPVYIEAAFVPRLMMPISLSYDHRLIDGADAARFVKWIKEAVENPFLLILEG